MRRTVYERRPCRAIRRDLARSVILPDISIGSVEEVLIRVQLVLQERPPEFPLYQALALRGMLPVGKADFLHDVVDVRDESCTWPLRINTAGSPIDCHRSKKA